MGQALAPKAAWSPSITLWKSACSELMDKFFSGEDFTQEEIRKGLLQGVRTGAIAPVL